MAICMQRARRRPETCDAARVADDPSDVENVTARLRRVSWKAPVEEQLAAINAAERVGEALKTAQRWGDLAPLAGRISEAYCTARLAARAQETPFDERRRYWCEIETDAARRAEGEHRGPLTVGALMRLGRSQITYGERANGNADAHRTFMQAVAVAERVHGADAPQLVEVLHYAMTGAPPDVAVSLAERAVRIAERAHGGASPKLGRPLARLAEALAEVDRIDEAIAAGERAWAVTDEKTRIGGMLAMLLAMLYARARRFDDAVRMRVESVNTADSDPERHVARGFLAETLHAAGRFEESLAAIDEAISLHGEGGWYGALRALALDGLGRDELASAAAQRAIELARTERGETFAQKIAARVGDIANRRKAR
jgi:tetratricopeptide (TPR) repeat protein